MALPFIGKKKVEEVASGSGGSELSDEDVKHFQALLAKNAQSNFAPDEWSFIVDSFEELEKANFITKELALSNIKDDFEMGIIWAYFRLLQYISQSLPDEKRLKRYFAAKFYGRLWLNCSDKALARILMKTSRAVLEKKTEEVPKAKQVV